MYTIDKQVVEMQCDEVRSAYGIESGRKGCSRKVCTSGWWYNRSDRIVSCRDDEKR
ncbi:uncharacterized protein LACBIDRAFT_303062 [Laccaria bicolor S238N-H82]|uniref:Predicted protein n=1 Tax=Laccaria bicolor (strain S238N-H82 / ATCC MYA-4686) TaxID=486041 RepID=B0DIV6_LACBS|nr:uncharacterized protein LACBIDRAFT_303062 [Laccaria bicolor S238N-H82]EDR05298.1 predicted protein [Laccaria bicolor S238N-H82]|eukprot:XP_001883856.1 predicted protein [Laccaria bicolor S238N-H82]